MHFNPKRVCLARHSDVLTDVRVLKEARALRDAGYEVDVVCLRRPGHPVNETLEGINYHRIGLQRQRGSRLTSALEYGLSFIMMSVRLTKLFLRKRHALIQVNTMPDFLVFVTLVPRLLGARVLLDLHEPVPELWMTKFDRPRRSPMVRVLAAVEQAAIRYSHQAITVNETIRKRFVSRGCNPRKVAIVRNVPDDMLVAHDFGRSVQKDGFTLITHGTIEKYYGHEVMIRALPILRGEIGSLKLVVAGGGNHKPYVEELGKAVGCADMVRFIPWIPADRIAGLILQADIGLITHYASPFIELAQPNKLFEYVALKIPVITSRFAAIEETFDDNCLMYFTPGSSEDLARCILELYQNPGKRRRMAENAYKRYLGVRWIETKKDYLDVVNRTLHHQ